MFRGAQKTKVEHGPGMTTLLYFDGYDNVLGSEQLRDSKRESRTPGEYRNETVVYLARRDLIHLWTHGALSPQNFLPFVRYSFRA